MRSVVLLLRVVFEFVRSLLRRRRRQRGSGVERTIRNVAAVHEAGHALVALRCTLVEQVLFATIDLGEQPRVEYVLAGDPRYEWCDAVIALSGIAAEVMVFGSFRSRLSRSDLVAARMRAESIVSSGVVPRCVVPDAGCGLDFSKVFADPPSARVLAVMDDAYRTARSILRGHVAAHGQLVGRLLHFEQTEASALAVFFGDRSVLRRFRHFGVLFV